MLIFAEICRALYVVVNFLRKIISECVSEYLDVNEPSFMVRRLRRVASGRVARARVLAG